MIVTVTPSPVEVSVPMWGVPRVVRLTSAPVEVTAPAIPLYMGVRTVLLTAASFAVVASTPRVLVGKPGTTLDDLVVPDLVTPNVFTQTTYEATVGAAVGLPSVTLPTLSMDLTRRLYTVTRPIFGHAPNGKGGRDTGVYISSDLGVTWRDLPLPEFPLFTDFSQPVFAVRGGRTYLFFADLRGQVARYDVAARTMSLATFTGTAGDLALERLAQGLAIAPGASQIVLYASGPDAGIWRSTDNGATFALSNAGQTRLGGFAVAFHPVTAGLCYASGIQTDTLGTPFYISTDSGATWALASTLALAEGRVLTIALGANPDIVYVRTQLSILKSLNQGATWAAIHTGITPTPFSSSGGYVAGLAVSQSNQSILYAAVSVPGTVVEPTKIYKSVDAGATWALSYSLAVVDKSGPVATRLAIHPTDPDRAAFATISLAASGVYATSNGGTSWALIAGEAQGITLPMLWGVAYGAGTEMAATGRHEGQSVTVPVPPKIQIGTETSYGEKHDATVILPYSTAFVDAVTARTVVSGTAGVPPVFPPLQLDMVHHYRSGAVERVRLAEIQMETLDVQQGSGNRQITIAGRKTHDAIARGPQTARTVPLKEIEHVAEDAGVTSATLPGIRTDINTYDTVVVNGKTVRLAAIRYTITTSRRATVLSDGLTGSAAIDPAAQSATAQPYVAQGRVPPQGKRGGARTRV